MTQEKAPNPLQELKQKISRVQSDVNTLQSGVRLNSIRDEVEDIENLVSTLPQKLQDVRTKGYVFEKELETKVVALRPQWDLLRPSILAKINQHSMQLDTQVRALEPMMLQLTSRSNNPGAAGPFLNQVESTVSTMKSKVSSTESMLRGMYDSCQQDANKLKYRIEKIEQMLDRVAAATFKLNATEGVIAAVKAVWAPNGKEDKDDPEGYLFLTDQRLIFEQNEEIARKKILFITTESEKVQKLLFEFPVVLIQDVTPTKLGMFKNEDHIDLKLASGAPFPTCHLHLDGQDCKEWDQMINRVITKEYDRDRAVAISEEAKEKVKKAPSQCPSCGGTINKPVLRGQDAITCDYCGFVIRL